MGPLRAARPPGARMGKTIVRYRESTGGSKNVATLGPRNHARTVENIGFYARLGLPTHLHGDVDERTYHARGIATDGVSQRKGRPVARTLEVGRATSWPPIAPGYDFILGDPASTRSCSLGTRRSSRGGRARRAGAVALGADSPRSAEGEVRVLKSPRGEPGQLLRRDRGQRGCGRSAQASDASPCGCQSVRRCVPPARLARGYRVRWTDIG